MSKYNLIKFIENSYSYYENSYYDNIDQDWPKWFRSVSRIYNHKMPKNVILAIKNKNNQILNTLCDLELAKLNKREKEEEKYTKLKQEKYIRWIERRNAGNKKIILKQDLVEEMFPIWNFQNLIKDRFIYLSNIWSKMT
jgi:hypothetical protein